MKFTLLIALLFSTQLFSQVSNQICGLSEKELSYPNLNWRYFGGFGVNSKFADVDGHVCLGVNPISQLVEKFYYFSNGPKDALLSPSDFMQYDVVIVHQRDLPSSARSVIRNNALITVKIDSEIVDNQFSTYVISFKFLKNLIKGFKGTIIKDLKVETQYNHLTTETITRFTSPAEDTKGQVFKVNKIQLNIGSSLVIGSIDFFYDANKVIHLDSYDLPYGKRKYKPAEEEEEEEKVISESY